MFDFTMNATLWILALYGLFEIIKTILYLITYTNFRSDGTYFIIATKNQEKHIEGLLRSLLFRILYGKEELKEIIVADLDSNDDTMSILTKLQKEYSCLKVLSWKECKNIMDTIKSS